MHYAEANARTFTASSIASFYAANAAVIARVEADPTLRWTCRMYDHGAAPVLEITEPPAVLLRGACLPVSAAAAPRRVHA